MTTLDASALASIFIEDAHSPTVRAWLRIQSSAPAVSSFAAAEFAAVVGRRLRMRLLPRDAAASLLAVFDTWLAAEAEAVDVVPEDHHVAATFVRRFDLGLRLPDALHLAVALRLGRELLTFDARQAAAARALGVACDPASAA